MATLMPVPVARPPSKMLATCWALRRSLAQLTILRHLSDGSIQPAFAKVPPLPAAAEAARHLIEARPCGHTLMRIEG